MKMKEIIDDVQNEMNILKKDDINKIANHIVAVITKDTNNQNLFVYGAGRSGFIGKSFVMRLVQLGLKSYFIGESATPLMQKDDILILISGSGQTNTISHILKVARINELFIILVTVSEENLIQGVDILAAVGGKSKIKAGESEKLPLASYFEINSLIFLDSIITKIMKESKYKKNIMEFGESYRKDEVIVF